MRKLIIAPSFLSKSLYKSFFQEDPFFDVKIISKEELHSAIYGEFDDTSVVDLMEKSNLSYQTAKLYLKYLPYIQSDSKNPKIHGLYALKDALKDHELKREYEALMYENKEVEIYGYSPIDNELKDIISSLKIKPTFKRLSSVDSFNTKVMEFVNIEDEAFFTMNAIAELIDNGVSIDDILIYSVDDSYNYYFDLFGPSFAYKIQTQSSDSFYSFGLCGAFIRLYKDNKDIEISINKLKEEVGDDPFIIDLINLINKNIYPELDFDKQFDLLINIFKETNIPSRKYSNSIQVIQQPTTASNKHIFILGFRNGSFPKVSKDNDYLSDEEKEELGINTSLINSKCQHDLLVDFLSSHNNFYISYSLRNNSTNYYVSPLVTEFNLEIVPGKFPKTIYSKTYADFYYAKAKDKMVLYREDSRELFSLKPLVNISYGSYDNQYQKFEAFKDKNALKLSYTAIDKLFNCPFAYYLDRVVQLDDFESTFNVKIGNIAHHVFQHCFDKDFDFEKVYEEGKVKQSPFTNKEELLLLGIKEDIKKAVKANQLHLNYIKNPIVFTEETFVSTIDEDTILEGKIDKGIIVDGTYLVIVDYKTGSKGFDEKKMQLGLSLQLPIYCYLASTNEEYKNYQIGGIYINNVINNNTSNVMSSDDLIPEYLKLNGKTLQSDELVQKLDSSIGLDKSSFISSLRYLKSGALSGSSLIGQEKFEEYIQIAKDKIQEANKNIRNNDFMIAPKHIKGESACKYCSYRDICFLKPEQIQYVEPEEEEEEEDE